MAKPWMKRLGGSWAMFFLSASTSGCRDHIYHRLAAVHRTKIPPSHFAEVRATHERLARASISLMRFLPALHVIRSSMKNLISAITSKKASEVSSWKKGNSELSLPTSHRTNCRNRNWSDDALARAIREGITQDGSALFRSWLPALRNLSDEDLAS